MDAERFRSMARALPHVAETRQWGENLVFWVGDKAVGGKMFALLDLSDAGAKNKVTPLASFSAGPERYYTLLEREGIIPAPYLARAFWVALEDWQALDTPELRELLAHAHARTSEKLPKRTKALLALPKSEYRKVVTCRRAALSAAKEKPHP